MSLFRCPVCKAPLARGARAYACPSGHSYDLAREGYAYLLPPNQKHSAAPGDDRRMAQARRDFLSKGYYEILLNTLCCQILSLCGESPVILDAGCGEGYYTAGRLVGVGIAYNNALVTPEEAPKTWSDLLDSKWKDQVVMSDPGTAGTTKYWMNAMMCSDKYGTDYMQKLHDNGCLLESGTTATHNQLAASAYKVGVCLDYVSANLIKDGSPITFLYPEETVSIASPIGLVKDCNNEANGKLLYDFILSKEGQEILVANNLVSVRTDVTQSVDLTTIPSFLECDMAKLAADSEANLTAFNGIWGL